MEVRLISYSEHSTFPELVSFVQYLKPRKIIPTVYSDQSHKRQIEGRFRNMLDSTRAKQAFFRSMTKKKNTSIPIDAITPKEEDSKPPTGTQQSKISGISVQLNVGKNLQISEDKNEVKLHDVTKENIEDNEDIEVLCVVEAKKSPSPSVSTGQSSMSQNIDVDKIDAIVSMGFDRQRAEVFLDKCNGNMQLAVHEILSENIQMRRDQIPIQHQKQSVDQKAQSQHHSTTVKKRKISDFFVQRK